MSYKITRICNGCRAESDDTDRFLAHGAEEIDWRCPKCVEEALEDEKEASEGIKYYTVEISRTATASIMFKRKDPDIAYEELMDAYRGVDPAWFRDSMESTRPEFGSPVECDKDGEPIH